MQQLLKLKSVVLLVHGQWYLPQQLTEIYTGNTDDFKQELGTLLSYIPHPLYDYLCLYTLLEVLRNNLINK